MPIVVAFFQQPGWSQSVRSTVAVILCAAAGLVTVYVEGKLSLGPETLATLVKVIATAQASYVAFWKRTPPVPALERATSPG